MYQELSHIYQKSIQQGDRGYFNIQNMEDHLKQKAFELRKLQLYFESQIKEIQTYEKKQFMYKRIINMILMTFKYFKYEFDSISNVWSEVRKWKEEIEENLKAIPIIVSKTFGNSSSRSQNMVKSRVQVNQNQFKRIQMKYRQQIQKQSQTIIQLEIALKNKSLSKNKFSQQTSSIHLKSQNVQMSFAPKISPAKELKQSTKYNNLKEKSVSITKFKNSSRNKAKQQIIQKIRKYHKCKTMRQNALQNKTNEEDILFINQIPNLPELKINYNFAPPISSGYDILLVNGKQIYKGMWNKASFQGRGKYYSDNWVYDGQFKQGNIYGFGTLSFNGYTFIGRFQNGQAQGQGTLYKKQKQISGIWKNHIRVKQS